MESEEFYRKIQEKIERTEFTPDFLEWNQNSVWQRIEQQKPQTKMVFMWRYAAAASVALICIFGLYFLNKNNQPAIATNQLFRGKAIKSTNEIEASKIQPHKGSESQKLSNKKLIIIQNQEPKPSTIDLPVSEDLAIQKSQKTEENQANSQPESHKHPMPATTLIAADSPFERILDVAPLKIELVDNQPFVEAPKIEKTVILEIPDSEEYHRPQKVEKRNFVARLFKQVEKFNTEGTVDWNELHVKPNKIWAYMKDSIKNEKRETK